MASDECKNCGCSLEANRNRETGFCDYCGAFELANEQEEVRVMVAECKEKDAKITALTAEVKQLTQDANRYRYIRDNHTAMSSPHMGGNHAYRFRCGINGRGNTFDEAIDNEMKGTQ